MFKRLWSTTEKGNNTRSKEDVVDEISELQPFNPFTELLFLDHHRDIVRTLLNVDSKRCVSAADDNLAIVWDVQFGYKLVTLSGHTRPITAMVLLPAKGDYSQQLVTGSSDKQIRMWDLETGDCTNVLIDHQASVKCLLLVDSRGNFCSGGENLCLWSRGGKLLHTLSPPDSDNDISLMISIRNDRIVAASDKYLDVYIISQMEDGQHSLSSVKRLTPHRESVRSLINVADNTFASASLDGTVIIWKTDTLQPFKYCNSVNEEYQGADKTFPYSVETMLCFQHRYIVASVGTGFTIYDSETGQCLLKKTSAHHSKITSLTFTCDGLFLATGAVDGSIRLWSFVDVLKDIIQGEVMSFSVNPEENSMLSLWSGADKHGYKMSLIGECLAHSGSVLVLLDCDGESFVSCGVDGLVIVWKNDNVQMMKRCHVLQTLTKCDGIV